MKAYFLALAAVLALAACGSEDAEEPTGAAPAAEAVDVVATDFAFDPSSVTVESAGTYTLTLANEGEFPHAIAFDEVGASTGNVSPGASGEVEVELEDGTYTMYCPVGDHRDRGREGTVVVGGAAGASGGATTGESDDSKPANDYGYG